LTGVVLFGQPKGERIAPNRADGTGKADLHVGHRASATSELRGAAVNVRRPRERALGAQRGAL